MAASRYRYRSASAAFGTSSGPTPSSLLFLAGVAVGVAFLATRASVAGGITLAAASASLGSDWWNLFILGGVTGALVLQLALLPGWVAEQDPWQKIWASRDDRAARRGLILGAVLLAVVYLACLVAAVASGVSIPYPPTPSRSR